MEKKFQWTIKEIASWASDQSVVQIPTIQRGLVWKPQQVELLWDSILRHFPIGAFTLSESSSEENPYNLLDGQQRWNAISLGYDKAKDIQSTRAIIWIDINPKSIWDNKKTTRKFFIRVTTKAHPWGYWSDDECTRLNTFQKREALSELGLSDKNIYHDGISLSTTYPVRSGYPLPLNWLLDAGERATDSRSFVCRGSTHILTFLHNKEKNRPDCSVKCTISYSSISLKSISLSSLSTHKSLY